MEDYWQQYRHRWLVDAGHAAESTAAAAGTTRQDVSQQFGNELGMSMEEGETGVAAGEVGAG